ncbi:MAG: hypothetical protein SAK29_29030 [Scytonema sp. PMC 1069.18]|nr:hypothetical protein [Scytonema sp. PMC 1069.18]MEC4886986.1 hypothetical protein [Scytonema sp. PMC 1070.18]
MLKNLPEIGIKNIIFKPAMRQPPLRDRANFKSIVHDSPHN